MVLSREAPNMHEPERQRAEFEAKLKPGQCDNPIVVWSDYVRWTSQHRPDDKCCVMLRAIKALASGGPQHHGDIRLLRLFCMYAENQNEKPTHKFLSALDIKGIGTKHTLLYECWARSLVSKGLYAEARAVFKRGIKRGAEPSDQLRNSFADFEQRMEKSSFLKSPRMPIAGEVEKVATPSLFHRSAANNGAGNKADSSQQMSGNRNQSKATASATELLNVGRDHSVPAIKPTQSLLTARKRVEPPKAMECDSHSILKATVPALWAEKQDLCEESRWAKRKVPAGRSSEVSCSGGLRDKESSQSPSKRRRLLMAPHASPNLPDGPLLATVNDVLTTQPPAGPIPHEPQDLQHSDTPAAEQEDSSAQSPATTLVKAKLAPGPEESVHGCWEDGLAEIGQQLLDQRDADAEDQAQRKDGWAEHVAKCGSVRTDNHVGKRTGWRIASWIPSWRRSC